MERLDHFLWVEKHMKADNQYSPTLEVYWNSFSSIVWASYGSFLDFSISVLNCEYYHQEWEIFKSLINHCGWLFPYEKVCFVSGRPDLLCFDKKE